MLRNLSAAGASVRGPRHGGVARRRPPSFRLCVCTLALAAAGTGASATGVGIGAPSSFVAAQGRRAALFGYSRAGLEAWAYPLQLVSGYRLDFIEPGRVSPLDGEALLSRTEVDGPVTTRVYVGPDFVVRERLSAAADAPSARIDYTVEGRPDVRLEVRFRPSLNLMWPGALGGQDVSWDAARKAYVEREPLDGFSAAIGSDETVDHDAVVNAAVQGDGLRTLVLEPRAGAAGGPRRASLTFAADIPDPVPDAGAAADGDEAGLRLSTSDPAFDAAFADAEQALEEAWVCAPKIGCGEVAGYGPSRPGRRPQYDWFFAGDGLVAADGFLATGRPLRARDEIDFVSRFQNPANGMIWHEMSLSAPYIDWARYPYMYAHVDITLQYLATFARYLEATDDRAFLARRRPNVEAAWRYARSLLDPRTGLPTIPAGKEGQNEQAKLADDVRLTSAWIDAADAMAELDRATGSQAEAVQTQAMADRARRTLGANGWDAARNFWIEGHTLSGARVEEDRSDAIGLLAQGVFTPAEVDAALDHLSTPAFRTDWGERSLSAASPDYRPNLYSQGAVWGLGTSAAAQAYWRADRPLVGWSLLQGLSRWNTLDSPGHLHEVLAGDLYHPEVESVPEQTWSSAGLALGTVRGLLGLQVDAAAGALTFRPSLPADWDHADVEGVRVGDARLDLRLRQDAGATTLEVDNPGAPVAVDFAPEVPLGASDLAARMDGAPLAATVDARGQDLRAATRFTAPRGRTRIVLRYRGGVRVAPVVRALRPGDASGDPQIASLRMTDGRLEIAGHVADPARADVELLTPLLVASVQGGAIRPDGAGRYRLTLAASPQATPGPDGYRPVRATVVFSPPPSAQSPPNPSSPNPLSSGG